MGNQVSLSPEQLKEMASISECKSLFCQKFFSGLCSFILCWLLVSHVSLPYLLKTVRCCVFRVCHLPFDCPFTYFASFICPVVEWITDSEAELHRLHQKFRLLDTDNSGTLSPAEFLAIPELEHNPLVRRVIDTFDADKNGEVDFPEFIQALSIFSTNPNNLDEKHKCKWLSLSAYVLLLLFFALLALLCIHTHPVVSVHP